ncbi:MAG: helix-turn-helix transcriptional regulator [Bifidobacteriaceae bacterium]|jgi:DNA-binding PadR family transcriptional regulator|nr:helix-turn-helix transcriptional regulator [Bifidobacteriaceae bacterium]
MRNHPSIEIDKELLRGHIDLIILAMLANGDLYGYDLAKRVKARAADQFELKEGTLYLALKRLEQTNQVESYWGEGGPGARRKYYKLLATGRRSLTTQASQWQVLAQLTQSLLNDAGITPNIPAVSPTAPPTQL